MTRRWTVYYGWIVVATVATLLTASAGARFLYGVVLKPLTEQFGWTRADLTGAVMVNMIILAALQPFTGWLCDRIGPKRILIGGIALIGVMLVPLSFATELWQIYLCYGIIGAVGFAATSPVNVTTLVSRWFTRRRGTALSIATSGSALGQLIIVPVATWLLTVTNWEIVFRAMAFVLVVAMIPLGVLMLRDIPEEELATGQGERAVNSKPVETAAGSTLRQALGAAPFWLLGFGFFVCGFTMAFANTHFMAFADDMGMPSMMAADVVAVTAIFSVIGTIGLGMLADRHERSHVLALTYGLRGCAFLLLLLLPTDGLMFIYAVVLGVSWSATTPLTAAISGDLYGRARLGLIFGTMYTLMNIGAGIGAFADGIVYDHFGEYNYALVANVIFGFAAACTVASVPRRIARHRHPAETAPLAETSPLTAD